MNKKTDQKRASKLVNAETDANNAEHKNLTTKNKFKKAMKDNISELLFDSNYFQSTKQVLNELNKIETESKTNTNGINRPKSEPHYFGLANKIVGFFFLVYLISGRLNEIRTAINAKSFDIENVNNEPKDANTSYETDFKKYLVHILFYLIILSIIIIINIFIFNFESILTNNPNSGISLIINFITNNLNSSIEKCIFGFNISVLLLISPPSVTALFVLLYIVIWFLLKESDGSLLQILRGVKLNNSKSFTSNLPIILLFTIFFIQIIMYFNNNLYLNLYFTIFIVIFIIIFLVFIIKKTLNDEYKHLSANILLGIKTIVNNSNVTKKNNNLTNNRP